MDFDSFLPEFLHTLQFSMLGFCFSLLLGMILAVFLLLPISFLHKGAKTFVEWVKFIPLLVFVLIFYFGLPALGFLECGFKAGTIGLSIYTGVIIGEMIYLGLRSIPKGQMDVALGTGLTFAQVMKFVIFPQLINNILAPLGNQLIHFIKYSSILGMIAAVYFLLYASLMYGQSYLVSSIYLMVGIFYSILIIPLYFFVRYLGHRQN
jgi:putative glutamine transport system permease protein